MKLFKQNIDLGKYIRKHSNIVVLILYVILTLVMTMPLPLKILTDIPGGGDAWSVLSAPYEIESQINDFSSFGEYFSKPLRIFNFKSHLWILHAILGEPLAYNIYWLSSFILAALAAYLLTKYLTKNKTVSFIAGVIYAFSPIHFAYAAGFGGATHIEWIPFYVLFLLKYIHKPSLKYFAATGLFFALLASNEDHFAAYTLVFTLLVFIYFFCQRQELIRNKKFIKYSALGTILGGIYLFWKFIPLIKISLSENNYLNPGLEQAIRYSADSLGIVVPPVTHLLYGEFFSPIYEYFTGNQSEHTIFIGFTTLFFVVLAIIYGKRKFYVKFWGLVAFVFYILSLGPFLHFLGTIEPKIPMPYLLFYEYVPFFDNIRGVGRMFIIAMLAFSILAGFGIKIFLTKYNNKKYRYIMPAVILFIIIFEFLSIPVKTSSIYYSDFYQKLKQESGNFKIIEVPGSINYGLASKTTRYLKRIHGKGVINGITFARTIPGQWDFQKNTPVINSLLYNFPQHESSNNDIIVHPYPEIASDILNHYQIKYITLHKKYIGEGEDMVSLKTYPLIENFIYDNNIGAKDYEDEELIAYKVDEQKPDSCFLKLDSGWGGLKSTPTHKWRRLTEQASLKIINPTNNVRKLKIELNLKADEKDNLADFTLHLNNKQLNSYTIGPHKTTLVLYLDGIQPDENILSFSVSTKNNKSASKNAVIISQIKYQNIAASEQPALVDIISQDKDEFAIAEIPFLDTYRLADETDTLHLANKKIISAQDLEIGLDTTDEISSFTDYEVNDVFYYHKYPILKDTYYDNNDSYRYHDIYNRNYYHKYLMNSVLDYHKIKYLIIRKDLLDVEKATSIISYWQENDSFETVYEDEQSLLLKHVNFSPNKDGAIVPILVTNNWGGTLSAGDNKNYFRQPFSNSIIEIKNLTEEEKEVSLKFRTFSCVKDEQRTLRLSFNDTGGSKYLITKDHHVRINEKIKLKPGSNYVKLDIYDEQGKLMTADNTGRKNCTINLIDLEIE